MRQIAIIFGITAVLLADPLLRAQAPRPADENESINTKLTWIQWWETNRDTYLRRAAYVTKTTPERETTTLRAVHALKLAINSENRDVRAEAVFALARLNQGYDEAMKLTRDKDLRVRCRAWVALGLLGKEEDLLAAGEVPEAEAVAIVTGLGLLEKPTAVTWDRLRETIRKHASIECRRMAVWALRVLSGKNRDDRADDRELLMEVLRTTKSASLATEVITAFGVIGSGQNLEVLGDIAGMGDQTSRLPAVVEAMAIQSPLTNQGGPNLGRMRAAAALAIAQMKSPGGRVVTNPRGRATQQNAAGRVQATLSANAHFTGYKAVTTPFLIGIWYVTTSFYPGASVMALSTLGDQGVAINLLNMRWNPTPTVPPPPGTRPRSKPRIVAREDNMLRFQPQRGYAAIALGIAGLTETTTPDGVSKARETGIGAIISQPGEPRHLRAACALALGLSGRPDHANLLAQQAGRLPVEGRDLVGGHVVLALGMLHDSRALTLANQWFAGRADQIDVKRVLASDFERNIHLTIPMQTPQISQMDALLGTRAALLGLALLARPEAKPILLNAWGQDPWTSLEAARAMGWCGIYDGVDPMSELMLQTEKPNVAAWSARCLGEMLDPDRPSRLSRLVENNCYAQTVQYSKDWIKLVKDGSEIENEFHGLGNSFLYWQMLARPNGSGALTWAN